uniref:Dirigent protein n=1 Tax=Oryza meridionalis TaxID=40149 RepID=A0A0E0EEZ6_9ORYZ
MASLIIVAAIFLLSLTSASVVHGRRRFISSYDEPCMEMRLYLHDILYDYSNSTANSTSAAATKPTPLSTAVSSPGYFFGRVVVFNDPMTEGRALPPSLEETAEPNAWLAFSVVFNSAAHRGTLNLMGADPNAATRDISVVGGTGDFFMSRGASLIVAAIFLVVGLLFSSATVVHGGGGGRRFVRSYDEPCKEMRLYFHDILYDFSNSTANSTSAVVASPAALLRAAKNTTIFGTTVVFNDPMTEGTSALPPSLEETAVRAQGLYLYDGKEALSAWLAFSVVFNSTARRGTLSLMGADPSTATRDISVVGGTGDFFMSRGVATLRADAVEGFTYFRLLMDIKLYECYV